MDLRDIQNRRCLASIAPDQAPEHLGSKLHTAYGLLWLQRVFIEPRANGNDLFATVLKGFQGRLILLIFILRLNMDISLALSAECSPPSGRTTPVVNYLVRTVGWGVYCCCLRGNRFIEGMSTCEAPEVSYTRVGTFSCAIGLVTTAFTWPIGTWWWHSLGQCLL